MLVYTNPSVRNGATTLTVNQMPSHTHSISAFWRYMGSTDYYGSAINNRVNEGVTVNATGGSQAHAHSLSAT